MKRHGWPFERSWMLPVVLVALAVGHLIVPYVFVRRVLPVAIVSGLVLFIVAKHVGLVAILVAPAYNRYKRRRSAGLDNQPKP